MYSLEARSHDPSAGVQYDAYLASMLWLFVCKV